MESRVAKISRKQPTISITNEARFVAMRLAKQGYFGGDPQKILDAPIDIVLDIMHYEAFESDYMQVYDELNKPENQEV